MKREIKFRGKCMTTGQWVYGNYQAGIKKHPYIISWWTVQQFEGDIWEETDFAEVDPETVGQYTGLKDRNGKEICEGDIVRIIEHGFAERKDIPDFEEWLEDEEVISYEEYDEVWITYKYSKIRDVVVMDRFPVYWLRRESFGYEGEDLVSPSDCEVIGNRWDNPDLLEGGYE